MAPTGHLQMAQKSMAQCNVHMAQQCMALTVHRTNGRVMYGTNRTAADGTAMYGTNSVTYRWQSNVRHQQCTVQMTQQCMAPTVHRTDAKALYGTNRTPTDGTAMYAINSVTYIWHSSMALTVHRTDGTAVYGTNSAPYRWHSNVWHHQDTYRWRSNVWHKECNVHMARQCVAPTVRRTDGTAVYGTNNASHRWQSNVWHQPCTVQMAQQCMAPTVQRTDDKAMYGTNMTPTDGTAMYGTNSTPYR